MAVEIRRLQDSGGERFGIGSEEDDRADDLRIDSPLVGIGGLLQLGQIARTIECFCAAHIAEGVAAHDIECRVVDPFVRIADADPKCGQLCQCLFLVAATSR